MTARKAMLRNNAALYAMYAGQFDDAIPERGSGDPLESELHLFLRRQGALPVRTGRLQRRMSRIMRWKR